MLLARLQGHDKGPPPLGVRSHPDKPARHAAHVPLTAGEEAQVRAAELQGAAQRLPLAHHDIRPQFPRRLQHPQGDGIGRHNQQCALFMGDLSRSLQTLQAAEEVRILKDHAGGVLVHLLRQDVQVRRSLARQVGHVLDRQPDALGVRSHHLPVLGVHG